MYDSREVSPFADMIPGRLRFGMPSSGHSFSRFEHWLHRCNSSHDCAPPHDTSLPSRVLDVGSSEASGRIALMDSQALAGPGTKQKYVALSHCWGRSHRIVTRMDNLEAHKSGLDVASLPRTFQQAVLTTRRLQIRYLWIDSLCIVQDDHQEWEREASKMGEVYANSYLVIAADSGIDDSSGFLTDFDERKGMPSISMDNHSLGRMTIANAALLDFTPSLGAPRLGYCSEPNAIVCRPDNTAAVYLSREWMPSSLKTGIVSNHPRVYKIGDFGLGFDPIEGENLSKRGWTLQERFLAPRTLHFTASQTFWECQKCLLAEDGSVFPRVFPRLANPESSDDGDNSPQYRGLPKYNRIPQSEPFNFLGNLWMQLVEKYSARRLTYEKDKLPALSGLARIMGSSFNDLYHAGLWRTHLLRGLHWHAFIYEPHHWCNDPEHDRMIAEETPPDRVFLAEPKTYRSPSWSWASIDGEIVFKQLNETKLVAELIECFTPLAGSDEYGQVQEGGFIKLQVRSYPSHFLSVI